jgi:hypothetical protein
MNRKTGSNAGFFVGVLGSPEEEAIRRLFCNYGIQVFGNFAFDIIYSFNCSKRMFYYYGN